MNKPLKAFRNDVTEWVIAYSPEDASIVLRNFYGLTEPDFLDGIEWEECDSNKNFTFHGDDGDVTKTFAEWIAEKGRGFLATTEY